MDIERATSFNRTEIDLTGDDDEDIVLQTSFSYDGYTLGPFRITNWENKTERFNKLATCAAAVQKVIERANNKQINNLELTNKISFTKNSIEQNAIMNTGNIGIRPEQILSRFNLFVDPITQLLLTRTNITSSSFLFYFSLLYIAIIFFVIFFIVNWIILNQHGPHSTYDLLR